MSAMIQGTEEWLQYRRNKIGASDAPIIMGESPWKTSFELLKDKIFGTLTECTPWMQRGIDLEETARECFENMTGIIFVKDVIVHPTYEWMIASLDGIDIEQKNILEIKCPGKQDHLSAKNGKIPPKYNAQLQHQMEVCQLGQVHYFSFDGSNGIHLIAYRDDKYIKEMIEKEKVFWNVLQEELSKEQNKITAQES